MVVGYVEHRWACLAECCWEKQNDANKTVSPRIVQLFTPPLLLAEVTIWGLGGIPPSYWAIWAGDRGRYFMGNFQPIWLMFKFCGNLLSWCLGLRGTDRRHSPDSENQWAVFGRLYSPGETCVLWFTMSVLLFSSFCLFECIFKFTVLLSLRWSIKRS